MNALGWVVDEDCLALIGRRREATFAGAISFISSIGRGIAYVAKMLMSNTCNFGIKLDDLLTLITLKV